MQLRDAHPLDFAQILALNQESVHFLSALNPARLALLHGQAAYHQVLEIQGRVIAFLLAFREGAAYDSPNYQWFASRFAKFLYIDRVVVSRSDQGQGIGKFMYRGLFEYASRSGASLVTCEFDVDPPNATSQRFHESLGFKALGEQHVGPTQKLVSLQGLSVVAANEA
jgi:hypothetical protein